jgi:malate synthase
MEDAATAEIARSQVWQWLHNGVVLEGGERVEHDLVQRVLDQEYAAVLAEFGDPDGHYAEARRLFEQLALDDDYVDFLTLAAYDLVD